jgi:hypothetical protein
VSYRGPIRKYWKQTIRVVVLCPTRIQAIALSVRLAVLSDSQSVIVFRLPTILYSYFASRQSQITGSSPVTDAFRLSTVMYTVMPLHSQLHLIFQQFCKDRSISRFACNGFVGTSSRTELRHLFRISTCRPIILPSGLTSMLLTQCFPYYMSILLFASLFLFIYNACILRMSFCSSIFRHLLATVRYNACPFTTGIGYFLERFSRFSCFRLILIFPLQLLLLLFLIICICTIICFLKNCAD